MAQSDAKKPGVGTREPVALPTPGRSSALGIELAPGGRSTPAPGGEFGD